MVRPNEGRPDFAPAMVDNIDPTNTGGSIRLANRVFKQFYLPVPRPEALSYHPELTLKQAILQIPTRTEQ